MKETIRNDVIITIKSSQRNDTDSDSMELLTEGRFYKYENLYYISYKESELTGLDGRTTLKVDPETGIVTMTRSGSTATHMVFEPRRTHCTHYDTGFGVINMDVTTKKLEYCMNEDCRTGDLKVKYTLDINNRYVSTNTIELNIKEAQKHDKSDPLC